MQDSHGNTKLYQEVRAAIEIQCIDCHGTVTKYATLRTTGPAAAYPSNDNPTGGRDLTLLRTPGTQGGYADQGTQDLGRHEITFALAGHAGDWRQGQTDWQAYRLNQPLIAFASPNHAGELGKGLSLLKLNNDRVRVLALKKAELSDELIVRLVEMDGKPAGNVRLTFAAPVTAAREVNAQEQPLSPATVTNGELVTSFSANQPRTFALKLAPARTKLVA